MANSLESEAEKDEKKKEYSSSVPQQIKFRALHSQKKGVEVWKAIMFLMLGFYTELRKKVFAPFFLPSKLKKALGVIRLIKPSF